MRVLDRYTVHMELWSLSVFLLIVFIGSYVQAVAGFAMAMLIVAIVGGLRLLDLPTLGAVVSLLTILNVFIALRGHTHEIHMGIFKWLALGQVPAIFIGLQLLHWLDGATRWVLELSLGVFITVGGLSMFLRPHPWQQISGRLQSFAVGVAGGLVGGMFSASGPVLGWFAYNQPLAVAAIRATLLACFVLTTVSRTILVGIEGGLTQAVFTYAGAGLPLVVLGTWLGKAFAPPVSEVTLKRFAYMMLLSMGVWIIASTLLRQFSSQG